MKNYSKNVTTSRIVVYCFFILCSMVISLDMYAAELSFNSLFPATWYEKGLNATIFVWHKVQSVIDEKVDNQNRETFDIVLGRFAFAHFCLEKMYQNKQCVIDEDIMYLAMLLHKLENELIVNAVSVHDQERLACLSRMVARMKQSLHCSSFAKAMEYK